MPVLNQNGQSHDSTACFEHFREPSVPWIRTFKGFSSYPKVPSLFKMIYRWFWYQFRQNHFLILLNLKTLLLFWILNFWKVVWILFSLLRFYLILIWLLVQENFLLRFSHLVFSRVIVKKYNLLARLSVIAKLMTFSACWWHSNWSPTVKYTRMWCRCLDLTDGFVYFHQHSKLRQKHRCNPLIHVKHGVQ